LVYHNDRAYWGFAANVHFMTAALNYALANRRVFIAQESDHWNYGGRDCRHGWHCYFHSPSNCSEREVIHTHTHTHTTRLAVLLADSLQLLRQGGVGACNVCVCVCVLGRQWQWQPCGVCVWCVWCVVVGGVYRLSPTAPRGRYASPTLCL
jgi:hypothetical protein